MVKAIHLVLLKLLMIIICTGWISLWVIKPTKLWTRIWHGAEDTSRTTVFSYYGLNFGVYSFPAIALAILVLIYIDLQPRKLTSRRTGRISFAAVSSPAVINSTFGVLSCLEILLVTSFLMFLTWTFYVRISNDFHKMKPDSISQMSIWEFKYLKVATRFGSLAEACLVLMMIPTLRGMSLFRVLGLQFEASVKYHIWLATAMLCFSTAHGFSTLLIWGIQRRIQTQVWKWQEVGRVYLAGELALITAIVIWITSLPWIRRKRFEIFYYTHHLYILFLILFLFHAGDRHFYTVLGGVLLFGVDKLQRIVQSRPHTCAISACILPCNAVELSLPKDSRLIYLPTSTLLLKIPQLSRFEWHPFSIISSSDQEDTLSVLVKSEGKWTEALYTLVQSNINEPGCIPVAAEGPYGPSSLNFLRYESLILIAGGIGVSPILSILRELASSCINDRLTLPTKITLIHVIKRSEDVCLLNSILPILQNQANNKWKLNLKVFITQENKVNATLHDLLNGVSSQVQNMNFNRTCQHCVILGTESSSWMAAMAFISTVMFLFLVTCFHRIFIPDMPKNSKRKSPSILPDAVVIASFFIAVVSSCVLTFILRWRKLRQQDSSDAQKNPKPVELVYRSSVDGELHFGARPDFRETLSEFLDGTCGWNVGVFVSGPETMTQAVAMFCKENTKNFQSGSKMMKLSFNFHSLNFAL